MIFRNGNFFLSFTNINPENFEQPVLGNVNNCTRYLKSMRHPSYVKKNQEKVYSYKSNT